MGILKNWYARVAHRIYLKGKIEEDKIQAQNRTQFLNANLTADSSSSLIDAVVVNNQNDRSKIVIGSSCIIHGELQVFRQGGKIVIGDYCFLGRGSRIWSSRSIVIGHRVLISHNVNIHDTISHSLDARVRHEEFKHIYEKGIQAPIDIRDAEVVIEDDVWIGFNVIILKGVTIGKGAVIGAGSIVTKDVPAFSVVIGNAAEVRNGATTW